MYHALNCCVVCASVLAAANLPGPSSEGGKGQKRKLASSVSKEGGGGVKKSKRRRKNDGTSEDNESQDEYVASGWCGVDIVVDVKVCHQLDWRFQRLWILTKRAQVSSRY